MNYFKAWFLAISSLWSLSAYSEMEVDPNKIVLFTRHAKLDDCSLQAQELAQNLTKASRIRFNGSCQMAKDGDGKQMVVTILTKHAVDERREIQLDAWLARDIAPVFSEFRITQWVVAKQTGQVINVENIFMKPYPTRVSMPDMHACQKTLTTVLGYWNFLRGNASYKPFYSECYKIREYEYKFDVYSLCSKNECYPSTLQEMPTPQQPDEPTP
jgi:hypothetical protein